MFTKCCFRRVFFLPKYVDTDPQNFAFILIIIILLYSLLSFFWEKFKIGIFFKTLKMTAKKFINLSEKKNVWKFLRRKRKKIQPRRANYVREQKEQRKSLAKTGVHASSFIFRNITWVVILSLILLNQGCYLSNIKNDCEKIYKPQRKKINNWKFLQPNEKKNSATGPRRANYIREQK